jgi:hypothetical protein
MPALIERSPVCCSERLFGSGEGDDLLRGESRNLIKVQAGKGAR